MAGKSHIDITLDLHMHGGRKLDLRIPVHQTITQLLANLAETLNLDDTITSQALKIATKELILTGDDRLADYPVTDGDVLVVLVPVRAGADLSLEERNETR